MEFVHILSILLFWRDGKISAFWIDLYERLKQDTKKINSLNSTTNKSLLGISNGTDGWIQAIMNPVGDFITCLQNYSGFKPFDTNNVFHLLKAFRNLASHKYGYENITKENVKKLNKIKEDVNKKIMDGRVKYWLENFPEFSLITYRDGFQASLSSEAILSEFKHTYYPQVNIPEFESCKAQFISPPSSLCSYSETLAEWIVKEAKKGKTVLWKHSFTTQIDHMEVSFLDIPENAVIGLENRELLTLNWIPAQSNQPNVLQLSRNVVSLPEETSFLFKESLETMPSGTNPNTSKSIRLEFTSAAGSTSTLNFPFVCFTDVIPAALHACLNMYSKGKQCVIFTNQPTDYIKRVVKHFFNSRNMTYFDNPISWNDLSTDYRKELIKESFPLHENSNIELNLTEICSLNCDPDSNSSLKPGDSSFTNISLKSNSSTNEQSAESHNTTKDCFLDIDSMLLELMHDKSRLLFTFIDQKNNLIPRDVSLNSEEHIQEKDLTSLFIKNGIPKSKNFYLIHGPACIGKSTLLSTLGNSLICDSEQLVLFTTCFKLRSLIENSSKNFVETFYQHNKFQQRVAHYIFNSQKYPITIIIDNFHQLCTKDRVGFFTNFLIPFFDKYKNLVINIFLSARSSFIFEKGLSKKYLENHIGSGVVKVNYLELKGLGNQKRITHMTSLFHAVVGLHDPDIVTHLVKDCINFIQKEFGELANTPFACQIILEICNDLDYTLDGLLDTRTLEGPYIYEKFHNMHLREEVAKTIQTHDIPKEFQVNSQTVNMSSSVFQTFKKAMENQYGLKSLELRFPNSSPKLESLRNSFSNVISDPLLDMDQLSDTFFPDYYCSLIMFHEQNFITEEVFNFEDTSKDKLKHYHILKFLDILLQGQNTRPSFFKQNLVMKDAHRVLFVLIRQKLYHIFLMVVEVLARNIEGDENIWSTGLNEIEKFLVIIMKKAIMSNYPNAITFLVDVIGFDWTQFKVDKIELNLVDVSVLQYLPQNVKDTKAIPQR